MNAIALRTDTSIAANDNVVAGLATLVKKAALKLASAESAAEYLDARNVGRYAFDAGKAAEKLARAKGAYEEVISAIYHAQADALEIEALAKRRLADEYDAAQRRGEIKSRGNFAQENAKSKEYVGATTTRADVGLTKPDIQYARQLRNLVADAEKTEENPVRKAIDAIVADGGNLSQKALATRLNSFSGDNEWYTPARYVDMAREVMGTIDTDPASNPTAQRTVRAATYYTAETNGLDKPWSGKVWMNPPYSNPEVQQFAEKVISEFKSGSISEAIVLTNNSADTGWHRSMQDACTRYCTATGRIRFESPTRQGNSPAMGQSFFYFGEDPERFKEVFSAIGKVWAAA